MNITVQYITVVYVTVVYEGGEGAKMLYEEWDSSLKSE